MKVCMYTFCEEKCGVAEYSRSLAQSLSKLIAISTIPIKKGAVSDAIKHINECDIVHIQHNYEFWGSDFISSSKAFHNFLQQITIPVVCTLHSVWPPVKPKGLKMKVAGALGLYNYYNHRVFDRSCAIIIHTEVQKNILVSRGFKPEDIFIIPAGVPVPLPVDEKKVRDYKIKWGIEGKKSAGLFGFISRYKSYELAVDALASLPDDYVLVFAGEARSEDDKKYLPELMEYVAKRGLSKRVRITGFIPESEQPHMFSAINIFVAPYSENASISYALNLCLAYSKPVIAADIELSRKIDEKYGCLELFKAGDAYNLREKILAISGNESRKRELSANCARFHSERNWDAMAAETFKTYEYCIKKWKKKNV